MKYLRNLFGLLVLGVILCGPALAVCDCENPESLPKPIADWCEKTKIDGRIVSYDYDEDNNTYIVECWKWDTVTDTAIGYVPATQIDRTPFVLTVTDTYNFTVEKIGETEEVFNSEECINKDPATNECVPVVEHQPAREVAFAPEYYQSPTKTWVDDDCWVDEEKTQIKVPKEFEGTAKKLSISFYKITENFTHAEELKQGDTTTEVIEGQNPCPDNCATYAATGVCGC